MHHSYLLKGLITLQANPALTGADYNCVLIGASENSAEVDWTENQSIEWGTQAIVQK